MGKMKNLVIDILEMYEKGYSVTEIADLYGMRQESVMIVCGVQPVRSNSNTVAMQRKACSLLDRGHCM